MSEFDLIPELGDRITIESALYGETYGLIIYRSESLIRIRPYNAADRGINFPLDSESQEFTETLGVKQVKIHRKATDPHFSKQLSVFPGERLEFLTSDGAPVPNAPMGTVAKVIATEDQDAIVLTDGRILDFQFLGPPEPIEVIVPHAAEDDEAPPENNTQTVMPEEEEEEIPEWELPPAIVEEIPTSERTYPDSVQREEMFISLLMDIPASKQKNPRVLRNLYRKTDILLALKNAAVVRNEEGTVQLNEEQSFKASTAKEILDHQQGPVAALLPVAAVKKVLYTDDTDVGDFNDVEIRPDVVSLLDSMTSNSVFKPGVENPFLAYIDLLLRRNLPTLVPLPGTGIASVEKVQVDQDVLRTRLPDEPVQGFPYGLGGSGTDASMELTADFLGTVDNRTTRVLAGTYFRNEATGQRFQTSAPDTAATVAHIFLPTDVASLRTPIRSSVLLWDIEASERSRAAAGTFYKTLQSVWNEAQVVKEDSDVTLSEELKTRLVAVFPTSIASRAILSVTDAMGLRGLEFTDPMMTVLTAALTEGCKAWDAAMDALRKQAIAALQDRATVAPVHPTVSADSPLWTPAILENPLIAAELTHFQEREPDLQGSAIARAAAFSKAANGTLGTFWYALASQKEAVWQKAQETYMAERTRLERNLANERSAAAALSAQPTLNSCRHVHELESLRGVREDGKRMLLLQRFVERYKGGMEGNWVTCGACKQHLVCRHEILLLNEFLHPGRGQSLHKSLLLEFSGPVFEGAYICKNCGQKIADLEYDTGLEYGDDGQPLVGRTVIDSNAEDAEELDQTVAMAEEGKEADTLGFPTDDLPHFYLARAVLENAGIVATPEMYRRVVESLKLFLAKTVPDREKYEKRRLELQATAKKGMAVPLPFAVFEANFRVGGLGALAVLELQTSNPSIPFPARGCKLDKGGMPLEESGNGAIRYMSCVIAGVLRKDEPWISVAWNRETNIPKRIDLAERAIVNALSYILGLSPAEGRPPHPPIADLTDKCQQRLTDTRNAMLGIGNDEGFGLASAADHLPPQFRPMPRRIALSEMNTNSVGNADQLLKNAASGNLEKVGSFIQDRQKHLIFSVMNSFHTDGAETAAPSLPQRSDSVCCYQSLKAVRQVGCGVRSLRDQIGDAHMEEVEKLETAAHILRDRDPTHSANGTHLYVPWSAPPTTVLEPTADPSMYYLLFLKHCFRGNNMGGLHEFQDNHECRHCGFQIPALEFLVPGNIAAAGKQFEVALREMNEERKALALKALADQGVTVDELSFRELEDAIHIQKSVHPQPAPETPDMFQILGAMGALVAEAPFLQSAVEDWAVFQSAVQRILENTNRDTDIQRRLRLSAFSGILDERKAAIQLRLLTLFGARSTQVQKELVEESMVALEEITDAIKGSVAIRNVERMFGIDAEQIAAGYDGKGQRLPVNKWFPKVSRSHKELLEKIWDNQGAVVRTALKALDEETEVVQEGVRSALRTMSAWVGRWTYFWTIYVRPILLTEEELKFVLEWSVLHILAAFLTDSSPLFSSLADVPRKKVIAFLHSWILDSLKQTLQQVSRFQMSAHQIQEAIQARTELEHAYFVKRFDDLDRDLRKLELLKKKYKIGDWNVGTTKNLFSYNADFFEFERAQRAAMGLPDFAEHIAPGAGPGAGNRSDYGFYDFGTEGVRMEDSNDHRVRHDEDA